MGHVQIGLHCALYTDRKCCQERSQFLVTGPSWDLSEEVSPLGVGGWRKYTILPLCPGPGVVVTTVTMLVPAQRRLGLLWLYFG